MIAVIIAALLGSAVTCYAIGHAFSAPRGSFLKTKKGIWLLVALAGTFVLLPPQLTALDSAQAPSLLSGSLPGVDASSMLTWSAPIGKGAYLVLWVLSSVLALLAGMRIWQVGTPEWRSGAGRAGDSSPASRVISLIPLADRIEDALKTLGHAGLTARDVPRIAESIRATGARFASSLPPSDGEVYRLVAARVPGGIAGAVTGLLLEGAGRRRPHD